MWSKDDQAMHHVVLQSFLIIHQQNLGANEVDGKMARAEGGKEISA